MLNASYGITKNLGRVNFDTAVGNVTAALKEEGFGVLTEIDVKATLKQKLDEDVRPYKILGACNPPLAHRAMTAEPLIGLLLPCNVIVLENEDGSITTSAVNPAEMFKVVENPDLGPVAEEVQGRLDRVIASL